MNFIHTGTVGGLVYSNSGIKFKDRYPEVNRLSSGVSPVTYGYFRGHKPEFSIRLSEYVDILRCKHQNVNSKD